MSNTFDSDEDFQDLIDEIILTFKNGFQAHGLYKHDEICAICYDDMKNKYVIEYPCGKKHVFHRNCVLTTIKFTKKLNCPLC